MDQGQRGAYFMGYVGEKLDFSLVDFFFLSVIQLSYFLNIVGPYSLVRGPETYKDEQCGDITWLISFDDSSVLAA